MKKSDLVIEIIANIIIFLLIVIITLPVYTEGSSKIILECIGMELVIAGMLLYNLYEYTVKLWRLQNKYNIVIPRITPQKVECFYPNGNSMGFLNEYEFNDLRVQITKAKIEGYYIKYKEENILINSKGQLDHYPRGLFDLMMEQFEEIFKVRTGR